MNRHPLHAITPEEISTYHTDGVVCLRNMLDQDWIARMQAAIARVVDSPADHGNLGPSHGKMTSVAFVARHDPDFRDFAALSPMAEIVGRVIESTTIRLFHDHLFVKPPLSPAVMQWHCDHTAWPVTGEMVPNVWTAFSPVNEENGRVEYLAGWHRHCLANGWRYGFTPDQENGVCPDFEAHRSDPAFPFRFVTFDMEPGDCVVFHPFTPHFSKGNRSAATARVGLALRVFGDDIVWSPDAHKMKIPDFPDPQRGEPPAGPLFPILWQQNQ